MNIFLGLLICVAVIIALMVITEEEMFVWEN